MTKKEEILKQSLKLLRQKGYFNTSIADLAEANGLVKSHFYHYFQNKEQLMEEALKMNVQYVDKNIISICHAENLTDKEKLNKVLLGMYKYFTTEKGGCIMGNTAIETSGLIKQFEVILKNFFEKMESAIALIFLERQGSKMAAKTGRRFVKEFQGALMLHKLYKDPGILSETLEEYKSIFKNSTKKKLMETNTVLPIDLNELGKGSMHSNLGIEITEITSDIIRGIMPVDQRTCQPFGILHGGASMVLAETLGSYGSYSLVDRSLFNCVGLEINANHVRSVTSGYVYGKATIVHKGRTTHIWTIEIVNEYGKLVCTGRITIAIIAKSEKQ